MAANGSVALHALAARLKTVEAPMRVELLRGLKKGAAPLIPAVQDAARQQLPKRGGLNEQVAGQKVTVSVRTGARTAGVRLATTAPDTSQTDQGFVRHPLPRNNRKRWVTQQIPAAAGWWSQTLTDKAPEVTPDLVAVMVRLSLYINGGV